MAAVDDARSKTLIAVDELVRLLAAQKAVVLLDVIDEQGAALEDRPKIPGALSVHLATDFSGKPTAASGRRPLPDVLELQSRARAWGIGRDTIVVAYDNAGGAQASRAWWTLRWAGLPNVRVLDGGYGAWTADNRPSSNHVAIRAARAGDVVLTAGCMPTIGAAAAADLAKQSKLFDARARAAYVGDPNKAGTGHIPGARHAPAGDNIAGGKFKLNDDLSVGFSRLGVDGATIGVYCGSGNAAAHAIAAMCAVGLEPALYVGSWSAWSADPSRPVATGPEPRIKRTFCYCGGGFRYMMIKVPRDRFRSPGEGPMPTAKILRHCSVLRRHCEFRRRGAGAGRAKAVHRRRYRARQHAARRDRPDLRARQPVQTRRERRVPHSRTESARKTARRKGLKGIVVELADGRKLPARYGGHPPRTPTDFFWTSAWMIPQDYPTGSLGYSITATDLDGNSVKWEPLREFRSWPAVIAGTVEYVKQPPQ